MSGAERECHHWWLRVPPFIGKLRTCLRCGALKAGSHTVVLQGNQADFTDAAAPAAPGAGLTRLFTTLGRLRFRAGAAGADTLVANDSDLHAQLHAAAHAAAGGDALLLQNLGGAVVDGQIPASIARDTELHAQLHAAAHAAAGGDALLLQNLGGAVVDAQIPAAIARDTELHAQLHAAAHAAAGGDALLLSNLGGSVTDAQIPAAIARDSELHAQLHAAAHAAAGGDALTALPLVAVKTADESVTNSTVQQNDDHLFVALQANQRYLFFLLLRQPANSADMDIGWSLPSGATMAWEAVNNLGAAATGGELTGSSINFSDVGTLNVVHLWSGLVTMGATAGNLQLQFAQNVSGGTASTLTAGSWLMVVRVS